MFRRLESSIPPDFEFPADLHGLGYFINDKDQIRMIKNPDQPFHYYISKNDRCVQMQREAMDKCIRAEVMKRLHSLGLQSVPLPLHTPTTQPHVPVLTTTNLATCSRVIVFVGEPTQDLGILAGRVIGMDSIDKGSAVNWVRYEMQADSDKPGIIIANPGQLVWWRKNKMALTYQSWHAIPRKTAVAPGLRLGDKNQVVRNTSPGEHLACVFEDLIAPMIERGCMVDLVGIDNGAINAFSLLELNWDLYGKGMEAMIILTSYVWANIFVNEKFKEWFGKRARAYLLSSESFGTPLRGRDDFGCNVFSAQEDHHTECIFPNRYEALLDYFKLVSRSTDYENIPQQIAEPEPVAGEWGENSDPWAASSQEIVQLGEDTYGLASEAPDPGAALNIDKVREVVQKMEDEGDNGKDDTPVKENQQADS